MGANMSDVPRVRAEGPPHDDYEPRSRKLHSSSAAVPWNVDARELGKPWARVRYMSETSTCPPENEASEDTKARDDENRSEEKKPAEEKEPETTQDDEDEAEEEDDGKGNDGEDEDGEEDDDKDGGGDDEENEEEDEEEEIVDPMDTLKADCEGGKCAALKARLDECNSRVRSCKGDTNETCEEEIIDFVHCVDHCVAKDLFKYLK